MRHDHLQNPREADMQHGDFQIGMKFRMGDGLWRVTDIGSRTVIAIRIDRVEIEGGSPESAALSPVDSAIATDEGWFDGPPYAVLETVVDEVDFEGCRPV
jgi:hypothetical protein